MSRAIFLAELDGVFAAADQFFIFPRPAFAPAMVAFEHFHAFGDELFVGLVQFVFVRQFRLEHEFAAQVEGLEILGRGRAHCFAQGPLDVLQRQRQQAALEGDAEHDDVGVEFRAEEIFADAGDVQPEIVVGLRVAAASCPPAARTLKSCLPSSVRIVGVLNRLTTAAVRSGLPTRRLPFGSRLRTASSGIDAEQQVGLAVGNDAPRCGRRAS